MLLWQPVGPGKHTPVAPEAGRRNRLEARHERSD